MPNTQIPLTVVALAMGWRALPSTREKPIRIQIDWHGVGLITGLVVASLVGVASVGSTWAGATVGVAIAAACAALLWRHSGRPGDPVLARVHLTRFPLRRIHVTSGMVLIAGGGWEWSRLSGWQSPLSRGLYVAVLLSCLAAIYHFCQLPMSIRPKQTRTFTVAGKHGRQFRKGIGITSSHYGQRAIFCTSLAT